MSSRDVIIVIILSLSCSHYSYLTSFFPRDRTGQLQVQHILDEAPDNWTGLTGHMTEDVLRDFLPSPESMKESGTTYKICTCGPKNFTLYLAGTKGVSPEYMGLLKDMGYPVENVFKF